MKKLLLFSVLLSLYGCDEVLIEENSRIEIKGSFISVDNEPVSGVQVLSVGTNDGRITANTDKILGKDFSGEDGSVEFISLDTYSHGILIAVNPGEIEHNENYSSLYFYDDTGNHSKFYDLEELVIARKVQFELNITNTSGTEDTLRYAFEYQNANQNFLYVNGDFIEEVNDDNFVSIREHRPDSDPTEINLSIMEETDLIFYYNLGESPVQRVNIPVSTQNNSYDFEY